MNYFKSQRQNKTLTEYVDDSLLIINDHILNNLFNFLDQFEQRIRFTSEKIKALGLGRPMAQRSVNQLVRIRQLNTMGVGEDTHTLYIHAHTHTRTQTPVHHYRPKPVTNCSQAKPLSRSASPISNWLTRHQKVSF